MSKPEAKFLVFQKSLFETARNKSFEAHREDVQYLILWKARLTKNEYIRHFETNNKDEFWKVYEEELVLDRTRRGEFKVFMMWKGSLSKKEYNDYFKVHTCNLL